MNENTLDAIKECSDIRIVSDTVANSPYCYKGITFIPQQSGAVRKLPFKTVTFCYHPNTMKENDFIILEKFLKNNSGLFKPFPLNETKRQLGLWDRIIRWMYFARRKKDKKVKMLVCEKNKCVGCGACLLCLRKRRNKNCGFYGSI